MDGFRKMGGRYWKSEGVIEKLDNLDDQLVKSLKGLDGTTVIVYHPAFGYFLDRYGLRQKTVEIQGKQPSPKQLRKLIILAKEHQVKVIFVQPKFDRHSTETLAKTIEKRLDKISLVTQAVWSFLKETHHLHDADLLNRIEQIDLKDGV